MPNNDTKYELNKDYITEAYRKSIVHTHTQTLDDYTGREQISSQPDGVLVQEEKTVSLKQLDWLIFLITLTI